MRYLIAIALSLIITSVTGCTKVLHETMMENATIEADVGNEPLVGQPMN